VPAFHVFHLNDYRPTAARHDRGQGPYLSRRWRGTAEEMLPGLHAAGSVASCRWRLFNQDYWKQDALLVARTGWKMKAVVRAALQ